MHPTNRHAIQLTQPARRAQPDPVTGAPRHPFWTSKQNRLHRAPRSDPKSPVQNRSTFFSPTSSSSVSSPRSLRHSPSSQSAPLPPFVEGRGLSRFRPALVVRSPPCSRTPVRSTSRARAPAVRSVHRHLLHHRSTILPSTTFSSTLQRAAALCWPASSALRWPASSASSSSGVKWSGRRRQFVDFAVVRLVTSTPHNFKSVIPSFSRGSATTPNPSHTESLHRFVIFDFFSHEILGFSFLMCDLFHSLIHCVDFHPLISNPVALCGGEHNIGW
jgi:hypothetical protein